jgi:hypothetical protein
MSDEEEEWKNEQVDLTSPEFYDQLNQPTLLDIDQAYADKIISLF